MYLYLEFLQKLKHKKIVLDIINASTNDDVESIHLYKSIPPLDDIIDEIEKISIKISRQFNKDGSIKCQFYFIGNKTINHSVRTPINTNEANRIKCYSKFMSLSTNSYCSCFVSEIYHKNGVPINKLSSNASLGIQIIGSTIIGTSFRGIMPIRHLKNKTLVSKPTFEIKRKFDHPFAEMFTIRSTKEMAGIIKLLDTHRNKKKLVSNFRSALRAMYLAKKNREKN